LAPNRRLSVARQEKGKPQAVIRARPLLSAGLIEFIRPAAPEAICAGVVDVLITHNSHSKSTSRRKIESKRMKEDYCFDMKATRVTQKSEPEPFHTPGHAVEDLHTTTETLRRYQQAGVVKAHRTSGGHRRYSESEVSRLKEQLKSGFSPLASSQFIAQKSRVELDAEKGSSTAEEKEVLARSGSLDIGNGSDSIWVQGIELASMKETDAELLIQKRKTAAVEKVRKQFGFEIDPDDFVFNKSDRRYTLVHKVATDKKFGYLSVLLPVKGQEPLFRYSCRRTSSYYEVSDIGDVIQAIEAGADRLRKTNLHFLMTFLSIFPVLAALLIFNSNLLFWLATATYSSFFIIWVIEGGMSLPSWRDVRNMEDFLSRKGSGSSRESSRFVRAEQKMG